jgi:hydroxymethylglutaryl-CoA reductase
VNNQKRKNMAKSKKSGFYKLSIPERWKVMHKLKNVSDESFTILKNGKSLLRPEQADRMIENVIGVFGLPMGLGLNFLINGKDYTIPMVVEEPSIVAAVSASAKTVREAGGFRSRVLGSNLIGQIQIVDVKNTSRAGQAILQNKEEIINLANSLHPNMIARGGGAKDLEVRTLSDASDQYGDMLIVHLLVDTQDAMGANLVNSMCEGVASLIEKISGGKVFLRILSNLADRSLVEAVCEIPVELLKGKGFTGKEVRDGIVLASEFAEADPYRAATHNKGIMNGIDPLIIATGNDWRAQEAAVHAYASRGKSYTALAVWKKNEAGNLIGKIKLPVRVGTVGGSLESNPMVSVAYDLLGLKSARELSEVIAAVGLAQNMSALKALATEGIQSGHMSLHARSVVMAAGAPPEIFETVVEKVIESKDIKIWKAKEIIKNIDSSAAEKKTDGPAALKASDDDLPAGYGKIILLGEHAVVYGSHAIAAPIPLAMQSLVSESEKEGVHLIIPRWGVEERILRNADHKYSIFHSLDMILNEMNLYNENIKIEVFPHIPKAMGLGGSAALAVAIIRALIAKFNIKMSEEEVNELAFKSEKIVHGSASGIDNTLATYGKFLLYKKGEPPFIQELQPDKPIRFVIGLTWVESLTAKMVTTVNKSWKRNKTVYNRIFKDIDMLVMQAVKAIKEYDLRQLGELMNINQGLLNALQVSGKEIEELIDIARSNGALGAKLTGGGGGGAIIALCPDNADKVAQAMKRAGYKALITDIQ